MRTESPSATRREDYQAPTFFIDHVALSFELEPSATQVEATLRIRRRSEGDLVLYGQGLTLRELSLNGQPIPAAQIEHFSGNIALKNVPTEGTLCVRSQCNPEANSSLEGLYITGGTFCTQCEAEGFRAITYFPDRPDVMARYTVTMRANKAAYPVLLANGNLVSQRDLPDGRHEAVWDDPFPKPSYLFALVAGAMSVLTDSFGTASGRKVRLEIYAEEHNLDQCHFAMDALKRAMRWDEQAYGCEYDLDQFMIYCADDFNFGAMENKGLNIFNAALLLGKRETATDTDFQRIEAVVAHEYFHNWSGNRVTCRDWFQLSLKEGLTVLRDQQFSASVGSPAVTRIEEINFLRQHQFVMDAGPLAHPVRPDAYVTIDNFYTTTIYEKGAEVVRMLHTLLGADTFRLGTDEYFRANDGTAATCDDFVAAMEKVSGRDLSQFKRWYSTPGTPTIKVSEHFNAGTRIYALTLAQSNPSGREPLHIPVAVGLLDVAGRETHPTRILELTQVSQTFYFENVSASPLVSVLRGFCAPVNIEIERSDATLAFLAQHDTDPVNRWDAFETLKQHAVAALMQNQPIHIGFFTTVELLLADRATDPAMLALMLNMPQAHEVSTLKKGYAPLAVVGACAGLRTILLSRFAKALRVVLAYTAADAAYAFKVDQVGRRALHNTGLDLLCHGDAPEDIERASAQYQAADNMTDQLAALVALSESAHPQRNHAFAAFVSWFAGEPLVVDKWFAVQAQSARHGSIATIKALMAHPLFDARNPNKVRAVLAGFSMRNWAQFHATDGSGYEFIAEQIIAFDARNPNLSAKLTGAFNRWRETNAAVQAQQRAALQRVREHNGLSENVIELVDKLLADDLQG